MLRFERETNANGAGSSLANASLVQPLALASKTGDCSEATSNNNSTQETVSLLRQVLQTLNSLTTRLASRRCSVTQDARSSSVVESEWGEVSIVFDRILSFLFLVVIILTFVWLFPRPKVYSATP